MSLILFIAQFFIMNVIVIVTNLVRLKTLIVIQPNMEFIDFTRSIYVVEVF